MDYVFFSLTGYHLEKGGGEVRLGLDVQDQGGKKILDVDGQGGGVGGLENWTILMDVTCVSSLIWNRVTNLKRPYRFALVL